MTEKKDDMQKTLDRFYRREDVITREMSKLAERGYIDHTTANNVIAGYQLLTHDDISEAVSEHRRIHAAAEAKKEKLRKLRLVTEQHDMQQETVSPNQIHESKQQPNLLSNFSQADTADKPLKKAIVKTPEQVRERNLQFILIAGVALLFLAGAVLATTNWLVLTPLAKVTLIAMVGVIFYLMSLLATKINIPQTSQAFLVLSCLFAPFPLVSAAYYQTFGSFFSLTGGGRFIFGFALTAIFTKVYYDFGKKYQLVVLTRLSLGLSFVSLLLLSRSFFANRLLQSICLLVVVALFTKFTDKISPYFTPQLKLKEWQFFQVAVAILTTIFVLSAYELSLLGTILITLLALLGLQLAIKHTKFQVQLLILSYCLLGLNVLITNLVPVIFTTAWSGILSSLSLVIFGFIQIYSQKNKPLQGISGKISYNYVLVTAVVVPLTLLNGANNFLFGDYFSLIGPGNYLFIAVLMGVTTISYQYLGKLLPSKELHDFTLLTAFLGMLSLNYALPVGHLGHVLINFMLLGLFNHYQWHLKEHFYPILTKFIWQFTLVCVNLCLILISIGTLPISQNWLLLLLLISLISLQLVAQTKQNQVVAMSLSYLVLGLSYLVATVFLPTMVHTNIIPSSLIVLVYTMYHVWLVGRRKLSKFNHSLAHGFLVLIAMIFILLLSLIELDYLAQTPVYQYLIACIILFCTNWFAHQFFKQFVTSEISTLSLIGLGFLLLIQLVAPLPISETWQFRLLAVSILLIYYYLSRVIVTPLFINIVGLGTVGGYLLTCYLIAPSLTLWEWSAWHLALWAVVLYTALKKKIVALKLSRYLPLGLTFSMIPVMFKLDNFVGIVLVLSLVVVALGILLRPYLTKNFLLASLRVSLFYYTLGLIFILIELVWFGTSLTALSLLIWGGILTWLVARNLGFPIFKEWMPVSYLFSVLYLLNMLKLVSGQKLIYLNLFLLVTYVVIRWFLANHRGYFTRPSLMFVLGVFWFLTITATLDDMRLNLSWLSLIIPTIIVCDIYRRATIPWLKYSLLAVNGGLVLGIYNLVCLNLFGNTMPLYWQLFSLSLVYSVAYLVLKKEQTYLFPYGCVTIASNILLQLGNYYDGYLFNLATLLMSITSIGFACYYLNASRIWQKEQVMISLNLIYWYIVLNRMNDLHEVILPSLVVLLMIASSYLAFRKTRSLLTPILNLTTIIQVIGLLMLLVLSVPITWLKLYALAWLLIFSFRETNLAVQRIERTLVTGLFLSFCYDGIDIVLGSRQPEISQAIFYGLILMAASILIRQVWQQPRIAKMTEWSLSALFLLIYLIGSLTSQSIVTSLVGAVFALSLVIIAYLAKYTAYFINGLVYLIVFVLYSQRHFWTLIPWWLYLALGGLLLIGVGSFSEWNRRHRKISRAKLQTTITDYFSHWK